MITTRTNRRRNVATDAPSLATCTCAALHALRWDCPNCRPGSYADAFARHAAAYNGEYDGIGSTVRLANRSRRMALPCAR